MALETTFVPLTVEELPALAAAKKDGGWRFVQLLAVNTEDGIDLVYSFMKDNLLENHEIKGVQKGTTVPSITDRFLEAFVFENETHDLFGVDVQGIAIDFGGNFYALAQKEPMTIISPEQKAAREKAKKVAAAKAAKEKAAKAREYRERLEAERAKVVEKAQAEARSIIQEARAASDLAISELKELKKRKDLDWQQVNDGRAEARRLLNEAERGIGGPVQEPEAPPPTRDAKAGDTVELVSMGTRASVLSVNKDGTLQLQAGILKISARQSEVRVVEGETQSQKEVRRIIQRAEHTLRTAAPREVDLRGMMTDEAIAALESFLDTAMLGKLETVTVIHGKGTGAVRNAVRPYLKRSRYVKSFRPGRYGEGEDGVTVVELK